MTLQEPRAQGCGVGESRWFCLDQPALMEPRPCCDCPQNRHPQHCTARREHLGHGRFSWGKPGPPSRGGRRRVEKGRAAMTSALRSTVKVLSGLFPIPDCPWESGAAQGAFHPA